MFIAPKDDGELRAEMKVWVKTGVQHVSRAADRTFSEGRNGLRHGGADGHLR